MGTKAYDNFADLITFSRASGGTALRHVGYGDELVSESQQNGSASNSANYAFVEETVSGVEAGKVYAYSYRARNTGDPAQYTLSGFGIDVVASQSVSWNVVNAGALSTSFVTYTGVFVAPSTALEFGIRAYPVTLDTTTVTVEYDSLSVKEVIFDRASDPLVLFNHPANIARVEYAADGTRKGLLIEEQRTNLVTYSEDFTHASWQTVSQNLGLAPIVTADQAASPDGNTNADRVFFETTGTSTTDRSRLRVASNTSLTGTGVFSVWIKEVSPGQSDLTIMITNGVGTTTVTPTAEWVRYSTPATAFTSYQPEIRLTGSDGTSSDVYIWGAQLEAGAFPTSYIPTNSGSTVTRSADVASMPVSAFGYNQKAGTVVVDLNSFGDNTYQYAVALTPTSATGAFEISLRKSVSNWNYSVIDNSVVQASINEAFSAQAKLAGAYKANSFNASINGSVEVEDTSGTVPSGLVDLRIGRQTSFQLNGHIKSIAYYPRRLSNAQLQELTA